MHAYDMYYTLTIFMSVYNKVCKASCLRLFNSNPSDSHEKSPFELLVKEVQETPKTI